MNSSVAELLRSVDPAACANTVFNIAIERSYPGSSAFKVSAETGLRALADVYGVVEREDWLRLGRARVEALTAEFGEGQ
jgi:hypothetical protein